MRTHNHHHEEEACCCGHHHHEHGAEFRHEHSHEPESTSTAMIKRAAAAKELILMKGMDTMPAAVKNMSTIIMAAIVVMSITTNIGMAKAVVMGNITTMNTKKAAAACGT